MDALSPEWIERFTGWGILVIGAVLTLVAAWILAGVTRRTLQRLLGRGNLDPALGGFLGNIAFYLIFIFGVVAALGRFGVETASFVAVLGALAFAIGFALQGSLSNFASGIMILMFRPFRMGDVVTVAGVTGKVVDIGIFSTVLNTPDNIKIIVPNGKVYGDTIHNITAYDTRRVDVVVGIGYGSSIDDATEILEGLVAGEARILRDPAHQIVVSELADSSVNLALRAWTSRDDYWPVKFHFTKQIKLAFDARGIEIPFPQRAVHLVKDD
jgi:small conductance mechanosensitive channel